MITHYINYKLTSLRASMFASALIKASTTLVCPFSAAVSNGVYCLCKRNVV